MAYRQPVERGYTGRVLNDRAGHVEVIVNVGAPVRRRRTLGQVTLRLGAVLLFLAIVNNELDIALLGVAIGWGLVALIYLAIAVFMMEILRTIAGSDTRTQRLCDRAGDFVDEWLDARAAERDRDPDWMVDRYLRGGMDWHELEMRIGAAVGVQADIERLRAFDELQQPVVEPRPPHQGDMAEPCRCRVCRESLPVAHVSSAGITVGGPPPSPPSTAWPGDDDEAPF